MPRDDFNDLSRLREEGRKNLVKEVKEEVLRLNELVAQMVAAGIGSPTPWMIPDNVDCLSRVELQTQLRLVQADYETVGAELTAFVESVGEAHGIEQISGSEQSQPYSLKQELRSEILRRDLLAAQIAAEHRAISMRVPDVLQIEAYAVWDLSGDDVEKLSTKQLLHELNRVAIDAKRLSTVVTMFVQAMSAACGL